MKRLDFLKRLGIVTAAIVVAPKIMAEVKEPEKPKELFINYPNNEGEYIYKVYQDDKLKYSFPLTVGYTDNNPCDLIIRKGDKHKKKDIARLFNIPKGCITKY